MLWHLAKHLLLLAKKKLLGSDFILTKRGFIIISQGILNNPHLPDIEFDIPLSPTGNMPQTHSAINAALINITATEWLDFYHGGFPSARIWIVDIDTNKLLNTNTNDTLGQVFTWQNIIDNINLKIIE